MAKKRSKKYDKPLELKEGTNLDDLIGIALQTPVKQPKKKAAPKKKK
jgi:hypothetical protein